MNPITMAIAAAHAIAARAVADGQRPDSLKMAVSDTSVDWPALDDVLARLTGDDLLTLAAAADVLSQRARAIEAYRRNSAVTAEINKLRKKEV